MRGSNMGADGCLAEISSLLCKLSLIYFVSIGLQCFQVMTFNSYLIA